MGNLRTSLPRAWSVVHVNPCRGRYSIERANGGSIVAADDIARPAERPAAGAGTMHAATLRRPHRHNESRQQNARPLQFVEPVAAAFSLLVVGLQQQQQCDG